MSNYFGSEGILSRLGVKSGVLFQHGDDPNRKIMSALAIAAMLSTTITSTAFAMQPEPIAEQAPSFSHVVQIAKNSAPTALAVAGKDGSMITISAEQAATLNPVFAQTLKKDLEKSIAIFQKTKSWDMVMAEVVAPGLQSKDPQKTLAAAGVLNFYHYSAARAAGSDVTPATNDAAAYIEARGPALEAERQVAEALITLDQASQHISGKITDHSLAEAVNTQKPGAFEKINALLNSHQSRAGTLTNKLADYQEYQLSILNQTAQYQIGNPAKMIPAVDTRVAELDAKYSHPLMIEDYFGNSQSYELDTMARDGLSMAEYIRDSFAHPANGKQVLQGLTSLQLQPLPMELAAPQI